MKTILFLIAFIFTTIYAASALFTWSRAERPRLRSMPMLVMAVLPLIAGGIWFNMRGR